MKKILFLVSFISTGFVFSFSAEAQGYKLGLGIRLSNSTPTLSNSISVKYFVRENRAVDGLVSFGGDRFGIGGLYEFHTPMSTPGLQWYWGVGAYVGFQNGSTYLGPTGAIGLDYKFEKVPLNLSLDWKPELDLLPGINFVPDAFGLTARFTLQ
jgi:hypothetical protein